MLPRLSVVICSLNGAQDVQRCLRALKAQSIRSALEVIVVDDGSSDSTSEVARSAGAVVLRHDRRRGASAARNTGIRVASAPVVAFLDDDCEPCSGWAEALLAGYRDGVIGVGGPVTPSSGRGLVLGYLARHNPIQPQELELAISNGLTYRMWLYLRKQWQRSEHERRRAVIAMPSANLSLRREALMRIDGFDERIRFGAEDDDLCKRVSLAFPSISLVFEPEAQVIHHFKPSLLDTLRRSRAYGCGSAVMYCKWPDIRPTLFPFPVVVLALLMAVCWIPALAPVTALLPLLVYPQGLKDCLARHRADALLDAYLQLMQEASENYGFVLGWCGFRNSFSRERPINPLGHLGDGKTRSDS